MRGLQLGPDLTALAEPLTTTPKKPKLLVIVALILAATSARAAIQDGPDGADRRPVAALQHERR